jgi:hypothetical protein
VANDVGDHVGSGFFEFQFFDFYAKECNKKKSVHSSPHKNFF